jgi:hypothetical protein
MSATSAAHAVHLARERLAGMNNVVIEQCSLPDGWPGTQFDLIVIGQLCYYLTRDERAELAQRACASLTPDDTLVACHWRHPFEGKLQTADDVHGAFAWQGRCSARTFERESAQTVFAA